MSKGRVKTFQRKDVKNRMMAGRRVSKCAAAAVAAVCLALQPGFALTAQANVNTDLVYNYEYPYWDDPHSSYYYDVEGRKVTKVTRTYDDGSSYRAEYKYDSLGHMLYANIKESDGSRSTINRGYNGDQLVSETGTSYDAASKKEYTTASQYSNGSKTYELETVKYGDGTSDKEEIWYVNGSDPLKIVEVSKAGLTSQTDYIYDEHGRHLTSSKVVSDGSIEQMETQYNEDGETKYVKEYTFDAAAQTHNTQEVHLEGEGAGLGYYTINTKIESNGDVYKDEVWISGHNKTKAVSTLPDGSLITENYSYDSDGIETLYTKSDGSGIIEKRETTTTQTGKNVVYYDNKGNTTTSSNVHDVKNGLIIAEELNSYANGSSDYTKQVYTDSYNTVSYMHKSTGADGSETTTERTYSEDGTYTTREREADGTVRETKSSTDSYDVISIIETLPDGTRSETSWEYREDGRKASETKRYSDQSEDKIAYEYNDQGNVIKETETRRNGISAVTQYQYSETGDTKLMSTTFSNGYQFTATRDDSIDDETDKELINVVCTYSAGDVSQHIVIDKNDSYYVKTVYRDGRTEESTFKYTDDVWEVLSAISDTIENYYNSIMDMAWGNQPIPDSAPETAAAANVKETEASNTGDMAVIGVPEAENPVTTDAASNNQPAETDEPEITGPASKIRGPESETTGPESEYGPGINQQ